MLRSERKILRLMVWLCVRLCPHSSSGQEIVSLENRKVHEVDTLSGSVMRPDEFLGIDAIQDINEGADFARTLCMNDHETIVNKA